MNIKINLQNDKHFADGKPTLSASELTVGYKERKKSVNILFERVKFSIYPGDFVCLLGPNGSGKSTLLRIISGIQKPIDGEILIDGRNIAAYDSRELAKKISIVLTEIFDINNASVYSIVSMGRYPHNNWLGILRREDFEIVDNMLKVTDLLQYKDKNFFELSDGIRQKVMIARALAQDTPLILLDEPTAYLDAPSRIEIMHMLRHLAKQFRKSIIVSSHDLDLALQAADKIMLITKEKNIEIDTPEDLVLNGHFETVFNTKEVKFHPQKGIFKKKAEKKITLKIVGSKTEIFWTERALERIGISIRPDKDAFGLLQIAKQNNEILWQLNIGTETFTFYSISELLDYLSRLNFS